MSENQPKEKRLPGLPFEQFEAAVKALSQVRRDGKFLLFLSRTKNIRFIGDTESYRDALATRVQKDLHLKTDDAQKMLEEVNMVLRPCVLFGDSAQAARFLEQAEYDSLFKTLDSEQKDKARGLLQKKAELAYSELFSGSLAQRVERLGTAVSPCVEDLDVEVVSERKDELLDEHISAPFLRLRLRYAEGDGMDRIAWFMPHRIRGDGGNIKTFEIECDETDIDLLLRRLLAAKERLLRATSEEHDGEPRV